MFFSIFVTRNTTYMKRVILLLMNLLLMIEYGHSQLTIIDNNCIPYAGCELSSLGKIHLEFDLSSFIEENQDVDISEVGIVSTMSAGRKFKIYKGIDTSGELLYSGYEKITNTSDAFKLGNTIELSLKETLTFEKGEDYLLYFPANCFYPSTKTTEYSTYKSGIISIPFKGCENSTSLNIVAISPESHSSIKIMSKLFIEFDRDVSVSEGATAYLLESGNQMGQSSYIAVESSNTNIICVRFDDITLYNSKTYSINLPENMVKDNSDDSIGNSELNLSFIGASFHPVETGRIYPSNNSELSWLSQVKIPFKFDEGYNLGRSEVKAKLYKGGLESEPTVYDCSIGSNMTDLLVDIWDFNLEPSTNYNLVIEEGQVVPTASDNISVKLLDTSNHDIVLTYTTPEVLSSVEKTNPTDVTPSANAEIDNLGTLRLTFQPYTFDGADYVVEMTEGAKATLSDGTSKWTVEMSYEGGEGGESYATADFNLELISGKDYKVTIPAGTFYPYAHTELMSRAESEAIELVFIGTTPAQHSVVISSSDGHTTTTIAMRHQDVVLAFEAPEGRNIENVTLNEQPIELNQGNYTIEDITEDAKFHVALNKVEPVVVEHDYVNVSLAIGTDENHAPVYVHPTEKGKDAKVNLSAGALWKLSSLKLNGEDVDASEANDGYYTIPGDKLNQDANLVAEFEYNGNYAFDFTTGVQTVEGCDYSVYSDNGTLVVENVADGANVAVYNMHGMLIDSTKASDSVLRLTIEPGYYVLIIGQETLKVRHQ